VCNWKIKVKCSQNKTDYQRHMKATLGYELPAEEEPFNDALHGPACAAILRGLIMRLTRLAYPSGDAPEHTGLQMLLRQLEQQMEEAGLNRPIQFAAKETHGQDD
jgi:hypothetical protein